MASGLDSGDGSVYTQQWLTRANAINDQVLKPNGLPANLFEPGATASTIGTSFQIMVGLMAGSRSDAADLDIGSRFKTGLPSTPMAAPSLTS